MAFVRNFFRRSMVRCVPFAALTLAAVSMGCASQIWNASDLIDWVKDRAVEQGCTRQSIELKDWYEKGPDGNEWHGSCISAKTGKAMNIRINVDSVWKPSADS
jgi:uncharacterized protein (DUF2147 family)